MFSVSPGSSVRYFYSIDSNLDLGAICDDVICDSTLICGRYKQATNRLNSGDAKRIKSVTATEPFAATDNDIALELCSGLDDRFFENDSD